MTLVLLQILVFQVSPGKNFATNQPMRLNLDSRVILALVVARPELVMMMMSNILGMRDSAIGLYLFVMC